MKIERIPYSQGDLADFFEEGLGALGGLCARTWHDRLEVVAEGELAQLWKSGAELHSCELKFVAPGSPGARSADTEVFPGCPITFKLCEKLLRPEQNLASVVLATPANLLAPAPEVAEKLWRAQRGDCRHWSLSAPFKKAWHFSLVLSIRFEIQAIDQQWALHRVAISLPDGLADDTLARDLGRLDIQTQASADIPWPALKDMHGDLLSPKVLEGELAATLGSIRRRQELHLQRELARIDQYFQNYSNELKSRKARAGSTKLEERLAAAGREHQRHRQDQVARHEIVVHPHVDTALLIAEPAFQATISVKQAQEMHLHTALLIPRSRRWVIQGG